MKSVQEGPTTRGHYLRRLHEVTALPDGARFMIELIGFADQGDRRKPVIVSEEPFAAQTIFTNTPNRPAGAGDDGQQGHRLAIDPREPLPALLHNAPPPTHATMLEITWLQESIIRLKIGEPAWLAEARDFGMLAPGALAAFTPQAVAVEEYRDRVVLGHPQQALTVTRDPWAIQIGPLRTALDDRDVHGLLCTPPPGLIQADRGPEAFWSWALEPDEHLYGLGERFTGIDHRGEEIALWNTDAWGTTTAASYKNVPFVHSSRGYGLFFHTPAPLELRLGTPSQRTASAQVGEPGLDLFVILAKTPEAMLWHYTSLTGRTTMPPRWAFGIWLSRCRYQTRAEVEAVAERARAENIPADVLHIDPAWLAQPGLNCDFVVNEAAFPDMPGMIAKLRERGFKISLWELPYVSVDSPFFAEAAAAGYFLKDDQGEPIHADFGGPTPDGKLRAVVDFTNLAAKNWWQDRHRPLLRAGVEVFKTDFGEGVPIAARAANGMTGYELRNLLPLLYNAAVHAVITEEKGRPGMVWGRSGWAGTQRYPAQWGGDPKTDAWSMRTSLRGGLNMALSAPGIWAHDIGGFYGPPPSPDLYRRWAAFGLLSPLARAHGTTPREPWEFGEAALASFRRYARLRMRLQPYLYSTAWEAHTRGLPMMRPLMLAFPEDPVAATIDDAFLLGHDLLIIPLFSGEPGAVERRFYLPPKLPRSKELSASWLLLTCQADGTVGASNDTYSDGWQTQDIADDILIYMRRDAILPLAPVMEFVGDDLPEAITLLCGDLATTATIVWDASGTTSEILITAGMGPGQRQLTITGTTIMQWLVQPFGWQKQAQSLERSAAGTYLFEC